MTGSTEEPEVADLLAMHGIKRSSRSLRVIKQQRSEEEVAALAERVATVRSRSWPLPVTRCSCHALLLNPAVHLGAQEDTEALAAAALDGLRRRVAEEGAPAPTGRRMCVACP
jgi:hypothetical protein